MFFLEMKKILHARLARFIRQLNPPLSREDIAGRYLKGEGIEIGALHNPLRVPRQAKVKYLDRLSVPDLRRQYPELSGQNLVTVDIIDDGETLATVQEQSQDFVIANHFLEHCQDPIRALVNMFRVLKNEGVLYLSVPDKRLSFDKDRPTTSLEHLKKDHLEGPEWSRRDAFEEYVTKVDKITDPVESQKRIALYMNMNYAIHFHAFTEMEMLELVSFLKKELRVPCTIELMLKHNIEVIMILRKSAQAK